jgi:hypothetical protein
MIPCHTLSNIGARYCRRSAALRALAMPINPYLIIPPLLCNQSVTSSIVLLAAAVEIRQLTHGQIHVPVKTEEGILTLVARRVAGDVDAMVLG